MTNAPWRLKAHVEKAIKEAEKAHKQADQDALPYKVIPALRIVRKAPKAFFDEPARIVRNLLTHTGYLRRTNEEIRAGVVDRFAPYPVPSNYMDKPLSNKQLQAIGGAMADAGFAFDPKVHKSLSKIKKAIQAGKSAADAELSFSGTITFGKDFVTVGTKRYPFTPDANGYSRIKVGSQKLRVDVLQELLKAGNLPSSTS